MVSNVARFIRASRIVSSFPRVVQLSHERKRGALALVVAALPEQILRCSISEGANREVRSTLARF